MKYSVVTVMVLAGLLSGGTEAIAGGKFSQRSKQGGIQGNPSSSGFRPTISHRLSRGVTSNSRGFRSRFSRSPRRFRTFRPAHRPFPFSSVRTRPFHPGGFGGGVLRPWGAPQKPFIDPASRSRSVRKKKLRRRTFKARSREIPHSHFDRVYRKGNSFSNYPILGWDAKAVDATPAGGN